MRSLLNSPQTSGLKRSIFLRNVFLVWAFPMSCVAACTCRAAGGRCAPWSW